MEDGKVFRLKKSLYGQRAAPALFFNYLRDKFVKELGYKQSEHDRCMFYRPGLIAVAYVDDILFFSKSKDVVDNAIAEMETKFEITKDDTSQDVFAYLGVEVKRFQGDDGKERMKLSQPGLIDKVITKVMEKGKPVKDAKTRTEHTPASEDPLHADQNGEDFSEQEFGFNYRQIIGLMMFLTNTRPDIQYAVNAASRFSHAPKHSHGRALIRIARYLKCTSKEGIIMKPTEGAMTFNCYVDADFAGGFGYEDSHDPICVKSRSGWVFTLGDTPVHWKSTLQSTISLSTVESEYVALSMALREFLPMRKTAQQVCEVFGIDMGEKNQLLSTVFEDNTGCLSLAKAKRMNPRTKHIATQYHWWHEHATPENGIEIVYVKSEDQKADIMTKGLRKEIFLTVRKLLIGW